MTLTFSLGWWLAPLAFTIIACGTAYWVEPARTPPRGYGDIVQGFVSAFLWGAALILSLIAWLIWAVLT
jgi:hypothetical protein